MKIFVALAVLFVAAQAADVCYDEAKAFCERDTVTSISNCNAKYGGIDAVESKLRAYANAHITRSYEYLLMSTHYANYEKNRPGFEKLFRQLSDSLWEDSFEIIKHLTKRGGQMDFKNYGNAMQDPTKPNIYELYELQSMAKALDFQKKLATEAISIHDLVSYKNKDHHDPEISSFIEEEFAHKHANTVRKLSGFITDLSRLVDGGDSSLAMYLFDEYLQKQ